MKRRRIVGGVLLLLMFLGVGILGAIRDNSYNGDLAWAVSYDQGLQQARESHRPLLLSFHTAGSDLCRKMDVETFTDPEVVEISHDFVCIRLDAEMAPELIRKYHVAQFPETILIDTQGNLLSHVTGCASPQQLISALHAAQALFSRRP